MRKELPLCPARAATNQSNSQKCSNGLKKIKISKRSQLGITQGLDTQTNLSIKMTFRVMELKDISF